MHYQDFGYEKYHDYLDGPEWQEIHDFFYKYCGPYKCLVCGQTRRLLLHKRSYEYLSMKELRRKYILRFIVIYKLKRLMCWLDQEHNGQVHFYDDGRRVPLLFDALSAREKIIVKRHKSIWRKILGLRPSSLFGR